MALKTTTRKATAAKKTKATTTHAKKKSTKSTPKKSVAKKSTVKKVTEKSTVRKYSPLAQEEVKKEMRKYKKGTATSGKAGVPVESREQAIAIGLSKARKKGAKVPKKKASK